MDLRGLAALFGKIDSLLSSRAAESCDDSLDLFGLSRFLSRRGEPERARSACALALDSGLPAEFRPQARRDLALHARRRGDHEQAAALWREIASDPEHGPQACQQLAIYYERRVRDYQRAAEFAQLAIASLRRGRLNRFSALPDARTARMEKSLQKRLARLQTRLTAERRSSKIFAQTL